MNSSVCGLIVTRNRLNSLKRTIQGLLIQTYPIDTIIIVDTDSTDGTKEYLSQPNLPVSLQVILQENIGGAGGFHIGLQEFRSRCFEWCWLMDDDGWPSPDALEKLEPGKVESPFWRNSLVINSENRLELAFELPINSVSTKSVNIVKTAITSINFANPFNGTLIHKNIVNNIGLPIPELFIKGDETEYQKRAVRRGFDVQTYSHSEFFHPAQREKDICEVSNSRVWIYYYKVRNIGAELDENGCLVFDPSSAYRLASSYICDIMNAYFARRISLLDSLNRVWVVLSGVLAAMVNIPFRWFVPK